MIAEIVTFTDGNVTVEGTHAGEVFIKLQDSIGYWTDKVGADSRNFFNAGSSTYNKNMLYEAKERLETFKKDHPECLI